MSLFGTGASLLLLASEPALASGFYLQEQSVRGWGRANSGEVADAGPASLWWNPAAIGWDGRSSASFGATAILPSGRVEDLGTQIDRPGAPPVAVGGTAVLRDPVQKGVLPSSAAALRINDRLALGLAISSPFSFTTDYDPNGWQRYSAIRTRLITLDVQPSLAWAPNDMLSIGAALNIEYSDALLSNALPNLASGSPDGRLRLTGNGVDFGWSVGAQVRPAPRVTIGVAYKSAIEHKLKGDVSITGLLGPLASRNLESDVTATFSTPWQLILGARAGVTERLTLNVQAVHVGWSKFERIDLGAPLNNFIPQGYKNSWSFAFGADAGVSERLTLRAGIQFDGTPTRDDRRDPRVPDSDRVNYNAGASLRMSQRITLDAAASYTDFRTTPITRDERFYAGTAAQVDVFTEGQAGKQRALVLSLGGRIGF
ncbi:MAG TPA: outer membrane protein transport protein [Allosphingosinicella sp.]